LRLALKKERKISSSPKEHQKKDFVVAGGGDAYVFSVSKKIDEARWIRTALQHGSKRIKIPALFFSSHNKIYSMVDAAFVTK
jgi:hypothetical protein